MKIQSVRATNKKNGIVTTLSLSHLIKEIKKKPKLIEGFNFEVFEQEFNSYKFTAWIHPKRGGDDYQIEVDQRGENVEDAKAKLEAYLSKVSSVSTDYVLVN